MLVGAGQAEGSMDASNMIKPALARGELHCVGATTTAEYRKYVEKDAALARRFQSIYIGEPSIESSISMLRGLKNRYEGNQNTSHFSHSTKSTTESALQILPLLPLSHILTVT